MRLTWPCFVLLVPLAQINRTDDSGERGHAHQAVTDPAQILLRPCGGGRFLNDGILHGGDGGLIRDPLAAHQQPMRVHPVGGAGDEGAAIPVRINREPGRILRQYGVDVQNHVRERFIQRLDVEHVALSELIEV